MVKFHDVEQNTPGWDQLRCGRVGGSSIKTVMANFGKAFGDPAKVFASNIALEQLTGIKLKEDSGKNNPHLQRGHDQEPEAREQYEIINGFIDVKNGGYFAGKGVGVSPDGLIGENGIIEIKSHVPSMYFKHLKRNKFNPDYKWQYFFQLKIAGKEWVDTVGYCEKYPVGNQIKTYRIYAEDHKKEFKQIDERLEQFFELVEDCKKIIKG